MTAINHSDHGEFIESHIHNPDTETDDGDEVQGSDSLPFITAYAKGQMTLRVGVEQVAANDDHQLHQMAQSLFCDLLEHTPGTKLRLQHDTGTTLHVPRGGTADLTISEREQLIHDLFDRVVETYEAHVEERRSSQEGSEDSAGADDDRAPARVDGGRPTPAQGGPHGS